MRRAKKNTNRRTKEREMKLTKRTFTTRDASGCEFKCSVYIEREYTGEIASKAYAAVGLGIEAETLEQLKEKVSSL